MSKRSNSIILGVAGVLFAGSPLLAKTPQKMKTKAVSVETAIIENTGSTNSKGYQITVSSTDSATMEGKTVVLPAGTGRQLFHDLAAAMPLSGLPVRHGMRSASFGTRIFVTYKGQQSPDLTFGGDPRTTALKTDIDAITGALHAGNTPRRSVLPPAAPEPMPGKN